MATEELIVRPVRAAVDRQVAHERIRRHSIDAARALKDGADRNDMLDRLANDAEFGVRTDDLADVLQPSRFVGRAPEQVDDFLRDVIAPILSDHSLPADSLEEVRV
jgi:adenylosuccinate lyase